MAIENVTRVTTPSGLEIAYCPEPRYYEVNGVRVPSVTEVLGVLDKSGALTWWAMKVGVEGVCAFYEELMGVPQDALSDQDMAWFRDPEWVVSQLTERKLTVNHRRDKAGTRGTSVHLAFERFAHTGHLPNVEEFPEEEQGYVRGLRAFLEAVPMEPDKTELMVGSSEHGFAGRFDLLAFTPGGEVKPTPRKTRQIPAGKGIWDLKTSKGIYGSHYLQLAAYRLGLEESGYGRSEYEAVVQVGSDGSWDVGVNKKRPEHFLAVRAAWAATR